MSPSQPSGDVRLVTCQHVCLVQKATTEFIIAMTLSCKQKYCKTKLEQIRIDTARLNDVIKQPINKTKSQVAQAEKDINKACDNVKSILNKSLYLKY